jgi:GR25 family glycosyltransferase involved in LPS biosynthesis
MCSQAAVSDAARPVADWRDFYLGDKPRASRVAYFEKERGERAIATAGAWGLFQSMISVITTALNDGVESLLILEDDVRFHRDTIELWPKVLSELPRDWQVFQLGAMQLHWQDDWINWHSQHLYKCLGSSIAAHAVALKRDAMQAVLDRAHVADLPFDIGALQEVKRLFEDQCFTAYPNLAIQDTQDSEIGMSKIFDRESRKPDNVYRWNWSDYDPAELRPYDTGIRSATTKIAATSGVTYLQPYSAAPGSADRVIVVFGPDSEDSAIALTDMLRQQKASGEIAPIVVIDDMVHIPLLRAAELAFEYVPTPDTYRAVLDPGRDARMMIERRLSIIRRKWRPLRIIALGPLSQERLETWRASPFEQGTLGPDLVSDDILLGGVE